MKAIRKEDGKEIDVVLFHPKEYIDTERDEDGSRRIYHAETLIVDEPADWSAFRRQAALYLLPFASEKCDYKSSKEKCVEEAIRLTDELIKQLKESEK